MWDRVRKSLTALWGGHVVATVSNMLLVPLYLSRWSSLGYGEWLVLLSLAGFLSTLDLGSNAAISNRLTQAYARGDLKEYVCSLHSAMALYLSLAALGSLLLILAILFLPSPLWLGLKYVTRAEANWVMLILGVQMLWQIPLGFPTVLYRTTGHLARAYWISNAQGMASFVGISAILLCGGGFRAVAGIQLALLLAVSAYTLRDVRRRFPALPLGVSQARFRIARELVNPSLFFLLITLAQAISIQGTVFLVSSALGGVAVALFAVSKGLVNVIKEIAAPFCTALGPEITHVEARREYAGLRSILRLYVAGFTTLCIAAAAALWQEGGAVITVWTRSRLAPDVNLIRLLLLQIVLQAPWLASSLFASATNRHEKLSWAYLASAVVGLGTAVFLIRQLGISAIPIGLMVGEALACYHFVIQDACRIIHEPYGRFARWLWLRLPVVLLGALLAGWGAHRVIHGYFLIRWSGVGISTLSISFLLAWSVWLTPEDQARLSSRFPLRGVLQKCKSPSQA